MPFDEALQRFSSVNIVEGEEEQFTGKALPFVKWAGGKRGIIAELVSRLPNEFENYYAPFVGGGALFFEIYDRINHAFLSDTNLDLVFAYKVIQNDVEPLLSLLRKHQEKHNEKYYYKIRGQHNLQDPIEIAARFIYLNKTCYNGLYRVNKKGEYNVPIGRYKNPNVVTEDNIKLCSPALKKATIEYHDFSEVEPSENDFVYLDPPYHPTTDTSFTSYTQLDFTEKDQIRLRDYIVALHRKNVKIMLSNSNTKFIKDLYKSKVFNTDIVEAPRQVNCKAGGRKAVKEVLIRNYK